MYRIVFCGGLVCVCVASARRSEGERVFVWGMKQAFPAVVEKPDGDAATGSVSEGRTFWS